MKKFAGREALTLGWLKSRRIAVLKGGWSRERAVSLRTGAAIQAALRRMGISAIGIDVKRDLARQLRKHHIDFCFIALHGTYGEDGGVQRDLDRMRMPYTGCGAKASKLAMDKIRSKKRFVSKGIPTPLWCVVSQNDQIKPALKRFLNSGTVFVKPFDQGSAIGASPATNETELRRALQKCFQVSSRALIERHVSGRELTVGILGNKALPVVEIVPKHVFYDYHSKYAAGGSRHLVPAPLSQRISVRAKKISLRAFKALGCTVYGRVDLMIDANDQLYVLEVNTIPGMTSTSLLPDAAKVAGISFDRLVLKIVELSRG